MPITEQTARPRGRPRSHDCYAAILEATTELLDERKYSEVSIDAVAKRAGVSKQTIYKWWSSKAKLAMEACAKRSSNIYATPDTGTLEGDLSLLLKQIFRSLKHGNTQNTWASLIAEAQSDPELAREFRETYIASRRRIGAAIVERGIERGEVRADIHVQTTLDMLYGPIWYRMLLRNGPLDAAFGRSIVAHLLPSLLMRGVKR